MQSSIFRLLCLVVFSFVIMSEPPEKISVVPAAPIAADISLAGEYTTASGVRYKRTASGVWKKQPQNIVPTIGLSARAGYYQTSNGQWRKIPTPRSRAPVVGATVPTPIVVPPAVPPPAVAPPIVGLDPAVEARRQSVIADLAAFKTLAATPVRPRLASVISEG